MTDLASVAKLLREIEDMATRLEARAIDRGHSVASSGDRGIPGGDALVNLASVGSIRDWTRREELREEAGDYDTSSEDPDERWPAIQMLWFWSEGYRQDLGHDYDDPNWRPTLVSEARFLRNRDVAEWIWNNEVQWDDYAKDVGTAHSKLEAILMEGERATTTRVVCPDCDAGRPLYAVYGETQDDDRWKCPACRHKFSREDVSDAYARQMRGQGVERWVPANDAISTMRTQGWREATVRAWLDDDDVEIESWCELGTRRRFVWWPDLWRRHLTTKHDRQQAAKKAADLKHRKDACREAHGEDCWVRARGCSVALGINSETTAV